MFKNLKILFPICRSITGNGLRKTIKFFQSINPEFKLISFKSGKKVFDWHVPDEWSIKDAFIYHIKTKKKYLEFKKNNLHVLNYSTSVNLKMSKKNLIKFIYTDKKNRNAISFVTSYYKKRWGFCASEKQKVSLPNGNYKVLIDSNFKKGKLDLVEAYIKGKKKEEIFFTSYICHPSMANNELSGPVVVNEILSEIKKLNKTKFSYRFVLAPETIGSICYLTKRLKLLKKRMLCGFVVSCVGAKDDYSLIKSPSGNNLSDHALTAELRDKKKFNIYSYLERGSDERQYCSPNVDLPVSGFCRTKYGKFKEYHTHLDNLNFVKEKTLRESVNVFKNIIFSFEKHFIPKSLTICEPFMTKRSLYPTVSSRDHRERNIQNMMDYIAYSNGKRNIFEISKILKLSLKDCLEISEKLIKNKLIKIS